MEPWRKRWVERVCEGLKEGRERDECEGHVLMQLSAYGSEEELGDLKRVVDEPRRESRWAKRWWAAAGLMVLGMVAGLVMDSVREVRVIGWIPRLSMPAEEREEIFEETLGKSPKVLPLMEGGGGRESLVVQGLQTEVARRLRQDPDRLEYLEYGLLLEMMRVRALMSKKESAAERRRLPDHPYLQRGKELEPGNGYWKQWEASFLMDAICEEAAAEDGTQAEIEGWLARMRKQVTEMEGLPAWDHSQTLSDEQYEAMGPMTAIEEVALHHHFHGMLDIRSQRFFGRSYSSMEIQKIGHKWRKELVDLRLRRLRYWLEECHSGRSRPPSVWTAILNLDHEARWLSGLESGEEGASPEPWKTLRKDLYTWHQSWPVWSASSYFHSITYGSTPDFLLEPLRGRVELEQWFLGRLGLLAALVPGGLWLVWLWWEGYRRAGVVNRTVAAWAPLWGWRDVGGMWLMGFGVPLAGALATGIWAWWRWESAGPGIFLRRELPICWMAAGIAMSFAVGLITAVRWRRGKRLGRLLGRRPGLRWWDGAMLGVALAAPGLMWQAVIWFHGTDLTLWWVMAGVLGLVALWLAAVGVWIFCLRREQTFGAVWASRRLIPYVTMGLGIGSLLVAGMGQGERVLVKRDPLTPYQVDGHWQVKDPVESLEPAERPVFLSEWLGKLEGEARKRF